MNNIKAVSAPILLQRILYDIRELHIRRGIKRLVTNLYCRELLPWWVVKAAFIAFRLKHI